MAKSNSCYFSHDSNAFTDIKIAVMRSEYGCEGYGLWWVIIEKLRSEEKYMLPLEKNTYRAIKVETGTSIDVEQFIYDCINEFKETEKGNGLFNTDGKYFWSESLLNRMKKMDEISAKRKAAGKNGASKRWDNKEQNNNNEKRKIKGFITKNSKRIANAIKKYGKCYKNNSKSIANDSKRIAKNSKSKSKSKIKSKIKIKSIYPSDHQFKKNEIVENMMDEMDKIEFTNMVTDCNLVRLSPQLCLEITEILKEIFMTPNTRKRIEGINERVIMYALKQFSIANTKTQIQIPKAYFKKCILSAMEQTELSSQYDIDTIYEIERGIDGS